VAASLDPAIKDIDYLRGYAHRSAGNFDVARQLLERFLERQPDFIDALASLGYVAIEQGRLDDAEAPLKRALSLEPGNVPVLFDYARLAVKRRQYEEAVNRLRRVIEKNPTHTQAHYQLFLAYSRLKQAAPAAEQLAEFKRLQELEKQVTQERITDEKLRTLRMTSQLP
jgi:tetratricopeptide (TPR) repeat protein